MSNSKDADAASLEQTTRYLVFRVGKDLYGVSLGTVREVIALPEVTPVPSAPPYFLGVVNLRGQVTSIVDLRIRLGVMKQTGPEMAAIICDLEICRLGVLVDSIEKVIALRPSQVSPPPQFIPFITGAFQSDAGIILITDIATMLSVPELLSRSLNVPQRKAA